MKNIDRFEGFFNPSQQFQQTQLQKEKQTFLNYDIFIKCEINEEIGSVDSQFSLWMDIQDQNIQSIKFKKSDKPVFIEPLQIKLPSEVYPDVTFQLNLIDKYPVGISIVNFKTLKQRSKKTIATLIQPETNLEIGTLNIEANLSTEDKSELSFDMDVVVNKGDYKEITSIIWRYPNQISKNEYVIYKITSRFNQRIDTNKSQLFKFQFANLKCSLMFLKKFQLPANVIKQYSKNQQFLYCSQLFLIQSATLFKKQFRFICKSQNGLETKYDIEVQLDDILQYKMLEDTNRNFSVSFKNVTYNEVNLFHQLMKKGLEINLVIGIDFTKSNLEPNNIKSLHTNNNLKNNPYAIAIKTVGQVLLEYDNDKQVPIYGFGGIPNFTHFNSQIVNHCFPLLGYNKYPEAYGLKGILSAYINCLHNNAVTFSGPTLFFPLIKQIKKLAQQALSESVKTYYVLLIVTDGIIDDMDDTIEIIQECESLPLSIVIVGVGNEDFSDMEYLNDNIKKERDIVSFLNLSNLDFDNLEQQVMVEVPQQVEDHWQSRGKSIDILKKTNDQEEGGAVVDQIQKMAQDYQNKLIERYSFQVNQVLNEIN